MTNCKVLKRLTECFDLSLTAQLSIYDYNYDLLPFIIHFPIIDTLYRL